MLVFRADDHLGEHLYSLVNLVELVLREQLLDRGLELLAGQLPLLDGPANLKRHDEMYI